MTIQYAKSTDPEVLATMERNEKEHRKAGLRIKAWLARFGATAFYAHQGWPSGPPELGVRALVLDEKPVGHGQWAMGPGGNSFRPAKRNPLYAEMQALSWVGEIIPGLEAEFKATDTENPWRTWHLDARPFSALGAAWVMLSKLPDSGEFGPQWTEVKASEAYAAKESLS